MAKSREPEAARQDDGRRLRLLASARYRDRGTLRAEDSGANFWPMTASPPASAALGQPARSFRRRPADSAELLQVAPPVHGNVPTKAYFEAAWLNILPTSSQGQAVAPDLRGFPERDS